MKKNYIIVESPSKINTIQNYIGDNYVVISSFGHINELSKGGRFGIGVNPLNNFESHYSLMPDKLPFLDTIISHCKEIDKIIIASDPDLEGEAIACHIASYLRHLNVGILRAEFHEMTKDGILNGLANTRELDQNKFQAQEARRLLDRIVGFMVSPFLINLFNKTLSAGRVQSIATKMVIDREKEILNFQPKEYWNLSVSLKNDKATCIGKYVNKLKDQEEVDALKKILESPSISESLFEVVSSSTKPKKELAPPPLNTAKMQQLMASKYNIDGEEAMQAAQNLYELGLCTYIRTDSVRVSDTALESVRSWLNDNKFPIPHKPNIFKNKNAAQDAHECIRPTDLSKYPSNIKLGKESNILYKLIWESFIASQMNPAIYDVLNVKINHIESKKAFKVNLKALKEPGYLALFNDDIKLDNLISINEGDKFNLSDENAIKIEQKFTQPPSRFTYGSLINELDQNGVGRPSTYVQIISKITNRNYVEKKGNTYYGTELGIQITDLLSKEFEFMKYKYTADLEKQMDDIAMGDAYYINVLSKFYNQFINQLAKSHINNGGIICSKCLAPMYLKSTKNNTKFYGCSLYPFCKSVVNYQKKEEVVQILA